MNCTASLSESKLGLVLAAMFGIASAWVILQVLPLGDKNILFLLALPLSGIFFLLIVTNAKIALIIILFTRASLDAALEHTRVDLLGQDIGAGGVINLFVLVLVLALVIRRPAALLEHSVSKSWVFYLIACAAAVLYSPVPGRAIRLFLNLLSYYGMLTIPFVLINHVDDKKFWMKVLLISTVVPVCFANLDLIRGGTEYQDAGFRMQGTFPHPNIMAFYLVFVITLVFYTLKTDLLAKNKGRTIILRIYILDLLILLISTKTRNAWLACWGLFFLYGLLMERRYVIYTLIAPLPLLFFAPVSERIFGVFGSFDLDDVEHLNSFTWRLRLWKASLLTLKKTFLFGNGLSSFEFLVERFAEWDVRAGAHNTYLEVIVETGLMGIAAYAGIYFRLLKTFYARMHEAASRKSSGYTLLFCYAGSFALVCFGDNMLYYLSFCWYFWFFMGIMIRSAWLDI